ncbi:MAG: hypothetical protein KDD94_10895, partial [Calditrichaeota bacterium]|nr:hypothetical protein [Calditrichota bacterium]
MKPEKISFLIVFGFLVLSCHSGPKQGQLLLYFSDQFKQFEQIELVFLSGNSSDSLSYIVNTGTDSIKVMLTLPYGFWNLAIRCNEQLLTDHMKTQIDIRESQSPLLVDLKNQNSLTIQTFRLTNERIFIESKNAIWLNKTGTYQFEKLSDGANAVWLNRQQIAFHDFSGASLNIFNVENKQLIRSIDIREYHVEGNNMVYWSEKQSFVMVGKLYHNVILLSVDKQVSQFKFKEIVISMIPQRGSDNLL